MRLGVRKWVLILTLLCANVSYAQQSDIVATLQLQINTYVAMAQAKLATYEQEAVDMYNYAKAYLLQKIQMITGANFNP